MGKGNGPDLLRAYLDRHGLSYGAAGSKWGISRSQLCRLANGKRRPSLAMAHQLEELTTERSKRGQVLRRGIPVAEWGEP